MVTRDVWTTQAERDAKLLLHLGHSPDKMGEKSFLEHLRRLFAWR